MIFCPLDEVERYPRDLEGHHGLVIGYEILSGLLSPDHHLLQNSLLDMCMGSFFLYLDCQNGVVSNLVETFGSIRD